MNYYDHEVNGKYNQERVKAEIDQIHLEARAMKAAQAKPNHLARLAGALTKRLVSMEQSLQHQIAGLLHIHPHPATIHIRRRR